MLFTINKAKKRYNFDVRIVEERPYIDSIKEKARLFLAIRLLREKQRGLMTPEFEALRKNLRALKKGTEAHKLLLEKRKTLLNLPEYVFVTNKIKEYKAAIKELGDMMVVLECRIGNHYFEEIYGHWIYARGNKEAENGTNLTREVIKEFLARNITELGAQRAERKKMLFSEQEFNGIHYDLTGGVFTKPGNIIKMQNNTNQMNRICSSKKPHVKIKDNYIGVELELISHMDRNTMNQEFINAKLAGNIHIKDDGSIRKESDEDNTHEVTILCKQSEYVSIIKRVCAVLNGVCNAYVNNSCGMHVHFDARNRDAEKMFTNLVRLTPLLKQLVPHTRVDDVQALQYCALNVQEQMRESKHPTGRDHRYQAVNPESYAKYKTIEVRLHGGTTNAAKIINWIQVCLFAVESTELIKRIESVEMLRNNFNLSSKLESFLLKRIDTFTTQRKACDTRSDHFYHNEMDIAI